MMLYHCSTTNTSCCLHTALCDGLGSAKLDLFYFVRVHTTCRRFTVSIHMIWCDGGGQSNQVWKKMWEVFFLMMNVMVDIMKASILISRCKSGLFGLPVLKSVPAFGFHTVVLWLSNWVFSLQTADVRLEEFVYEKLEKKVPTRMNNHELLGQSMIESGNEFGPGTAYGEWHTSTWKND